MTLQSEQLHEADLALLRRFIDTSAADAFEEIVRRYAGVVYSASYRILRDQSRAQDVSQETFFRLLRQPRLVTQSLGGWLHRSATHLAIDAKRSDSSRRIREKSFFLERQADLTPEPKWEDVSPHVDQALNELDEPARMLLVRHFLQGIPQANLAAELNLSPATVSRKLKAALKELQKQLRRKGICLSAAAVLAMCAERSAHAAPVRMLMELGKMQMIGPMKLSSQIAAKAPVRWPSPFSLHPALATESAPAVIGPFVGIAIVVVFGVLAVLSWGGFPNSFLSALNPTAERPVAAVHTEYPGEAK